MLRIDRNLHANLSRFKMMMEGSVVDPDYLQPMVEELGKYALKSCPLNVPQSYVAELHRACLGALLFPKEAREQYGCPVFAVARSTSLQYLSGFDGMSISPSQWRDLYAAVDAEIHDRRDGEAPAPDFSKRAGDFDSAVALFHDSRLSEFVAEVDQVGVLQTLASHFVRRAQSDDPVDSALLRLALATAMHAADVDVVAVCSLVHVASMVQAKGVTREVAEALVNAILGVAKDVYQHASGLTPFHAVASAIAHLIVIRRECGCTYGKIHEKRPYTYLRELDGDGNVAEESGQRTALEQLFLTSVRTYDEVIKEPVELVPPPYYDAKLVELPGARKGRDRVPQVRTSHASPHNGNALPRDGRLYAAVKEALRGIPISNVFKEGEGQSSVYWVWSRSHVCKNVDRAHANNNVWFEITRNGVFQRCFDDECRGFRSEPSPIPYEVSVRLFSTTTPESGAKRESAMTTAALRLAYLVSYDPTKAATGKRARSRKGARDE
eukprot:jgi/Mesvir1/14502/Mv05201-RA.1